MKEVRIGACIIKNYSCANIKGIKVTLDFGINTDKDSVYQFEGKTLSDFEDKEGNINEDKLFDYVTTCLQKRNRK